MKRVLTNGCESTMKKLSGSRVLRALTSPPKVRALGALIAVAVLAAACSSGSTSGSTASGKTGPAWCGKKDFVLGYSDGDGQNGWRKVTLALLKQAVAECPNITKAIYEDALGSAQTQVAQFNSLIAQGANVIVTIPDAGTPLLPVMRKAMAAHIPVIPFTQPPVGGKVGVDYVAAVVENQTLLGKEWGEWMCTTLHDKGNVVFMGGVPGNSQSLDELQGIKQAFSQPSCTGVKLLPGAPVTTDWQVAMYQSAMAGLIAKYGSKINGIIVDYGGGFNGAVAAYKAAGLNVPPVATNSDNQLTCSLMKQGDKFIEYTSGNKQVDNALQQGIAALNHTKPLQPALYPQHIVFNTEGGPKPVCDPSLPAGAALGEGLSPAQLLQILG
jgi:ribose transport system substrate-binding protein